MLNTGHGTMQARGQTFLKTFSRPLQAVRFEPALEKCWLHVKPGSVSLGMIYLWQIPHSCMLIPGSTARAVPENTLPEARR